MTNVVFGYVRASTILEVQQGSLERQRELIKKFCEERGWEVRFYEDRAKSGATIQQRPEFQRMMEEVKKQKPYAVIVSKIDRFARSLIDLLNSINYLQENGVNFISVLDSGVDTSNANGKLLLQILGSFAEFERALINERTRQGREKAKLKGIRFGRKPVQVDKRKVVELFNRGLSIRSIAKALNVGIGPVYRVIKEEGLISKRSVKKLLKKNLSTQEIARIFGVSESRILEIKKEIEEEEANKPKIQQPQPSQNQQQNNQPLQ
jgi:DNA invertase Pin-like site-specific DNA recombinase